MVEYIIIKYVLEYNGADIELDWLDILYINQDAGYVTV